jgi:hypothetical protein
MPWSLSGANRARETNRKVMVAQPLERSAGGLFRNLIDKFEG